MKNLGFVILSVILSVAATPLGDRAVFRRHSSVPVSRRYILESRTTAPAACAALPPSVPASSTDPSSSDIPTVDPTSTDPDTTSDTTSSRRSTFWARDSSFGASFGIDDKFSVHDSTAISFEESVSTFVQTWETLCLSSGGDIFTNDPCTSLGGFAGIDALLETAGPCDQHFIADSMITFAKSEGIVNRDDLINFAISYRRHARNAVKVLDVIPSSLFCLEAPINSELIGVYNEQLDGCDPGLFGSPTTSMIPFGSSGTCPLGMSADVDTCDCTSDGTDDSDDSSADSTDDSSDSTDDSSDSSDDSSDSTDDSSDSTDDSSDSTDDSSDSTDDSSDDSGDATSTDTADASSSTDAASTDTADASSATDATSTDTADASSATDATSTDTADASSSTDASSTDSADASTVTPPPSSTTSAASTSTNTFLSGPNIQPTDIAGDVNDPNGRRK